LLGRAAGAPAEAEPNAFRLTVRGESIFIAGRDDPGEPLRDDVSAGTLFGVYELLERVLGVRWLWPGELGTHVPAAANLVVPELDLVLAPALRHTRLRFGGLMSAEAGWSNPAAREKFIHDQLVWLRRHRLARGISLEYGHGFETWYERHAATHPEYFNLLPDGTRRSDPMYHGGEDRLISLSVAEPGVVTERIKEWSQQRTAQRPWVNGAENDTCGKCVCELCLAWDGEPATPAALARAKAAFAAGEPDWWKELGSVSDRYARFWMALQAEAQKTDPGATVLGYAYANYHEPPLRTRLNERIVVAIVPRLMYPWTAAKREAFRTQWAGWSAAGARLYLRPNYTLDGHAFPIWYADQLAEDFNFVHANGLIATDFDSLTSSFGAQGPTLYTLARLQQHPDWPAERILAEWYGAFGPAEAAVRAYGDLWRRVSAQVDDQTLKAVLQRTPDGGSWGRFYLIADGIFTPAVMAEAERLLAAARQAAGAQPTALRRVEFLEQGLRQAA
ncbi:MAG: DUF4838 domain-containing protein, partial [Armatimonadetes bacterium]|nr:DUF4838 domain-containing protein [Armatimonadota bacterium]